MTASRSPWPPLGDLAAWVDGCLGPGVRTGALRLVRERTWASVWTAPTAAGPVWLKVSPPATAFEMRLYPVLAAADPQHVLVPLGVDPDRGRLLLPDAGPPFARRFTGDALTAAMSGALAAYGHLQRRVGAAVPPTDLLDLGLLDMRPERMPARFDEAIDFARAYAGHDDPDAVAALAALRPRFADRCAVLAARGRPAGVDHNDLHAANVVGPAERPRFYDWGDSVLAHPFACLLTPLDTLPAAAGPALRDAYLRGFGDPAALRGELDSALALGVVARAHVWLRALGDRPAEHEHAHAPFAHLLRLLSASP
jgi:hypothetical protein